MREKLIQDLTSAWEQAIAADYGSQRINSERSLQASYWGRLNDLLPRGSRRIFIEPAFRVIVDGKAKRVFPDLVICNRQHVIGIVELKYQPRTKPSYRKDIRTLQRLSAARAELRLEHARHRGVAADPTAYRFSDKIVFAWAGVHAATANANSAYQPTPFNSGFPELAGCYLQLHAATRSNSAPEIVALRG